MYITLGYPAPATLCQIARASRQRIPKKLSGGMSPFEATMTQCFGHRGLQ